MNKPTKACNNCEKTFDVSYDFCPFCGQKKEDKLTLGVLFYNTISNYFSFDARFFKSFLPLMIKPGFLPEKFIEGKRRTYIHPAQFYLFISIVFFFLFSISIDFSGGIDSEESNIKVNTLVDKELREELNDSLDLENEQLSKTVSSAIDKVTEESKIDSMIQAGAPKTEIYSAMGMNEDAGYFERKTYEQMLRLRKGTGKKAIAQAFIDSFPIAMFFLLPIFALLLKLFFYKDRPYVWHLVFSFYFFCFGFALLSFDYLVSYVVNIPTWINALLFLAFFVYLIFAIRRFYKQSYLVSVIKSGAVSILFLLVVLPVAFAIMGLTAFFFY
ncbi:DUF3667 domain-containing protein [Galbibacter sp. EGI 63066]|uniref:DUF3667 domain-containing protein n=1 Tax=Galbibacter sp. EGI 63066 TaxID=2993559 RepID=UPI0022490D80|nr:DUF3667 domain-containing protein [Galbibacter sp. EGI 63066]MCX2680132.1 DUF3667 domain-containing protein [Galbibacter sp. EGI 63066]